jgi:hypothetical protein
LLAIFCLVPLFLDSRPVEFVSPHHSGWVSWTMKALVLTCMTLAIGLRAWANRGWRVAAVLVVLAAFLAGWHWHRIDSDPERAQWQRELYLDLLNHRAEESGQLRAPHQYRLLPYGFVRGLEGATGDFWFSCVAYRWFFSFWFLYAAWRFALLFLPECWAWLVVAPIVLLYPLSAKHYYGQLTDPLSHALFAFSLIYIVQERWLSLAVALALGVPAKETAMLLVPAYFTCAWRRGISAWIETTALAAVSVAAFFLARLPLGWLPGYGSINGTEGLMIAANLAPRTTPYAGAVPVPDNYVHPLLFVGIFLPSIAWSWRALDRRLRMMFLVLVPLLLLSNLVFGWMHESRNYMPLLPLLGTMALWPARRLS